MKRALLIGLSIVASLACGVILAPWAFFFAWGLGDFSVSHISALPGLWLTGLLMVAMAFVVPFFACRPLGEFWWLSSLLAVVPAFLFLGGGIIMNLNMGKVPIVLFFPLWLLIAGSLTGGFFGKNMIKSNQPSQPIAGKPGSG